MDEPAEGGVLRVGLLVQMRIRPVVPATEEAAGLPALLPGSLFHVPRLYHGTARIVAFDPSGRWLACGDAAGLIRLIDAWSSATHAQVVAHAGSVTSISLGRDADGRLLVASGGYDDHVRLHRLEGGALVPVAAHDAHGRFVYAVSLGRDDKGRLLIASGGLDGHIRLHRLEGDALVPVAAHDAHRSRVFAVSLGRDAEDRMLVASGGTDGRIHRFVLEKDDSLTHLGSFTSPVADDGSLTFLGHTDRFLGLSYQWGVRILDAETGAEFSRLHLLKDGFVWTEPPNPGDVSTFWTDRTDLIEVLEIGPDGEARTLPEGDPERNAYLASNNTPVRVRDMVFDPEGFAERSGFAKSKAEVRLSEIETEVRTQIPYRNEATGDDGSA